MGVQQRERSRRSRGRPSRAQCSTQKICKWEDHEVEELSKLILAYVQRSSGALPGKNDTAFWAACCKSFHGRFTVRQVQDKMRCVRLRFIRLASGEVKSVRVSERNTVRVWGQIFNLTQDTEDMEGPSRGKPTRGGSGEKGGVCAAAGTPAKVDEGQHTSTCPTEDVSTESQCRHHENGPATNAKCADYDVQATPESACNITLFQHIIAADLARTTKTLAKYVHSQGKHAMA